MRIKPSRRPYLLALSVGLLGLMLQVPSAGAAEDAADAKPAPRPAATPDAPAQKYDAANPKPPEGPGLAAKYPDDKGISKDSDVIFATDFSHGIQPPMRAMRKGVSIIHDSSIAFTGDAAAKIVATKGKDTGGDLQIDWKPGDNQVYVRVYVHFDKNTAMPHHFINVTAVSPTYKYRWGGSAGLLPPGGVDGDFHATLEPPKTPDGHWHFYNYWHDMHSWQTLDGKPDGRPNPYYGNEFAYPKQSPRLDRDKWICLEYMMKANTVGKHDGEAAFWIDGVNYGYWRTGWPIGRWLRENFYTFGPYFDDFAKPYPFEGFDWRTSDTLKINRVMLQWYLSDSSYKESKVEQNVVYFDNLVIAKKYIGPMVKPKQRK